MTKAKGFLYLTFVFGMVLQSTWAEEISYQGLKLAVNDNKDGTKISVERLKSKAAVTVERIDNPTRLVIDVPGHKIGGNRTFTLADSRFIAAARFGVHPDKTRIVLDVRPELSEIPSFKVTGESTRKTLLILGNEPPAKTKSAKVVATPIELKRISPKTLNTDSTATEPIPTATPTVLQDEPELQPVDQPTATPTAKANPTHKPTELPTPAPTPEPTALPTPEPTAKAIATPKSTPSSAKTTAASSEHRPKPAKGKILYEIDFAYLGDQQSPVLKIALGERTEFRLAKTDTKFYTITVPGFGVAGKHLLLPFFPPKDFVGFSVVAAKETSAGIEISIGVDPGVRLMAFADGNSILVKVP